MASWLYAKQDLKYDERNTIMRENISGEENFLGNNNYNRPRFDIEGMMIDL